ncbi:TRAP-type C4-dicarboxylate transport system, small permease component [Cohaesibacter sp. ES.047]|uniref:TRAP transporter small permease subunit n=1 Tax=Cohaesibacter sp. ES.047 TaxID=1798205 RepID=UPI000BB91C0A|nr:TRAP transporter small permease [Cohaesibacter sp. ES.047]SNY93187.1 TRAP-type C4-dicarboxylate transport system, small permease component [Cohaesibacter sp. ES.047]
MAGRSLLLTDDSILSKIDQSFNKLEATLAFISGFTVFLLMILAVISVGGRNLFNQPLSGYVDWIEQAMPLIAFMGISYVQRNGGHIRMDMVVGVLRGRPLYLVEWITTFAILILMALMVWGTWAHFQRSFDFNMPMWSRDSSMDIALPIWPAKLLAPVAFSVLCVRLVLQLWAYTRAFIRDDQAPIAVPLIADAATLAAEEAQHVSSQND